MRDTKKHLEELQDRIDDILEEKKMTFADRLKYLEGIKSHYNRKLSRYVYIMSPKGLDYDLY